MSIQSSINQMLGNVGLLANTFQFQKQINKTEDISSQVAQLNDQRAQLEADKARFQTESDKERAKISREKNDFKRYSAFTKHKIERFWENMYMEHPEYLLGNNPYAAGNDMAANAAQQRVDAEREKRTNQVEALQKAFQNIGMGGGNDNG